MKRINSKKIKQLIQYFKNKGLLNRNPRVLGLFISEKEKDYFLETIEKIENQIDDVPIVPGIQTHTSEEIFPTAGISFELLQIGGKYGLFTLALKYMYKKYGRSNKKPLSGYNYAILIREKKIPEMYRNLGLPQNVDRNEFVKSMILIHEFVHVVEMETHQRLFPETSKECLQMELNIIKELSKTFLGVRFREGQAVE